MPEPWTQKRDVSGLQAGWAVEVAQQRARQPHAGPALGLRLRDASSVGFSSSPLPIPCVLAESCSMELEGAQDVCLNSWLRKDVWFFSV